MPTLKIGEHSFECKPKLPRWQLMELAGAMKSDDPMSQMAAMHSFVLAVVADEDRARFRDVMQSDDDAFDALMDDAVGSLIEQYAAPSQKGAASARPTSRSSASPSGRSTTPGMSRVVSLQRGTVKEEPTSATDGTSVAS